MAALKKLIDKGVIIREGEGLHLLMEGGIKMIIPDKPNSRNQKYKKVNNEGKGHVSLLTKDEWEKPHHAIYPIFGRSLVSTEDDGRYGNHVV